MKDLVLYNDSMWKQKTAALVLFVRSAESQLSAQEAEEKNIEKPGAEKAQSP